MVAAGYPDFTSFYGAGLSLRQGQGSQLYDAEEQWRTQQVFAQRVRIRGGPLPYLRPPFETLLFVPLTLLSYPQAYFLWTAINLGIAVWVPFLLRQHVRDLRPVSSWLLALLPLAFTPIFFALVQGQDSVLLLLLYSLAYLALQKGADLRAGCWLALGLFKPHLVIPFVIILFFRGRRKVAWGFSWIAAVLLVVSVAIVGWRKLIRYPGYIWWLEQHTGRGLVLPRDTPNLRGLVEGFTSRLMPASVALLVIVLTSVAIVIWAGKGGRPEKNERIRDLVFCQALVATFLVSYHAFAYDLAVMLLPIALLAGRVIKGGPKLSVWDESALLAPVVVLLFGPIYPLLWLRFHFMNLLAIVLMLWMWGLSREISRLRAAAPPA